MSKTPTSDSPSRPPLYKDRLDANQDITLTDIVKSKTPVTTKKDGATPPKSPDETVKRIPLAVVDLKGLTRIEGKGVVDRLVVGVKATNYGPGGVGHCTSLELVGTKIIIDGYYHMPVSSGAIVGYTLAV